MKRLIDIALGAVLLLVTAPVVLCTAVAMAVALRTWPFFLQERVGLEGRRFRFVKLRTLPTDTPKYATKKYLDNVRMPDVCRAVRRLHIDELPQLWLVLTGRMSLVGPRPEMQFLHDEFDADFARRRTMVRPGCTGLWQVSTESDAPIGAHPEFDDHYLRHQSIRLDLWIIGRTIRLVSPFGKQRPVALAELPSWASRPPRLAEPQLQTSET